jgi:endothelin-converting enzyme
MLFYNTLGSNWEKSHEIPDGKSSINAFVSLIQQNKQVLHGILSRDFDDIHTSVLPDPKKLVDKQNFEKVKALYDSCMNQDAIDKRGASPIHDMVRQVKKITKQSRSFTQGLSYFAQRDIGVLFEIMVDADPKDPTQNSLQLYQSGLTLPSKVYYTQNATVNALEEAVADTLKAVFDDTGSEFNWIKDSARLVVDFEKELAAISQLPEELQDPETIYNPYSLSELAALVPGIDWGLYVDHLLPDSAPHPGKIVVTSPTYIGNVSKLLEETSEHTLQAYFTWQAIYNYANALNDEVRKPIRKLTATLIGTDPKVVKPRWDTCLDEVNGFVGFLAGRYYVLDKFGGDAKERADDFVNSIKQVFVQRLPDLTWLDDKTRERAVQKVDQLIRKVGYPDKTPDIMSPVSLSDYYTDLELKGSDFFGNYMRGREWAISQQWKQVGQTPDRSKWFMNPQEVNAYYNPSFNEVRVLLNITRHVLMYYYRLYSPLVFYKILSLATNILTI